MGKKGKDKNKGKGKGKNKGMLAVFLILFSFGVIASCSFMTSTPDTPVQQVTLDLIRDTSKVGCITSAQKFPDEATTLQTILRTQVIPVVGQRAALGKPANKVGNIADDVMAILKNWDKYLGVGLSMALSFAQSKGYVDTSAMYWACVQQVVGGCLEGLDTVLPTPIVDIRV
jgi:hypothetical protein